MVHPVNLRQGRHNLDIVYLQLGDEPSDDDPRVAVCNTEGQAELLVALANLRGDSWWFEQLRRE